MAKKRKQRLDEDFVPDWEVADSGAISVDPVAAAEREEAAVLAAQGPDFPEITLDGVTFDLDDPELPAIVEERALASGGYPYEEGTKTKVYEQQLHLLQLELIKLQKWATDTGARIVVLLEGRDAAGKGGLIGAFLAYMNPRIARVVALSKPGDRERGQWYFQRYVAQFPSAGEIVFFDRSWYNRALVEPVMGFCTEAQRDAFLDEAPHFEEMLVRDGIVLVKIWLDIGREMQLKRFHERRHDPLKIWKLSPIDLAALHLWDAYSAARDRMLAATHTPRSPWIVIKANDKKRGRLNAIRHVLEQIDYDGKSDEAIGETDPLILGSGPDFLIGGGRAT